MKKQLLTACSVLLVSAYVPAVYAEDTASTSEMESIIPVNTPMMSETTSSVPSTAPETSEEVEADPELESSEFEDWIFGSVLFKGYDKNYRDPDLQAKHLVFDIMLFYNGDAEADGVTIVEPVVQTNPRNGGFVHKVRFTKPGTFSFTLSQRTREDKFSRFVLDTEPKVFTITVTQNEDGNLLGDGFKRTDQYGNGIVFKNTYVKPGSQLPPTDPDPDSDPTHVVPDKDLTLDVPSFDENQLDSGDIASNSSTPTNSKADETPISETHSVLNENLTLDVPSFDETLLDTDSSSDSKSSTTSTETKVEKEEVKKEEAKKEETKKQLPKTGETNTTLPLVVSVISLVAGVFLFFKKRAK